MYKVELKFDTSKLAPETVNQMCEQADQIFEQEDLSCAVKALGSRIYLDRGRKQDYGRFWAAIFQLKNSVGIAENLLECFWYNGKGEPDYRLYKELTDGQLTEERHQF